MILLDKIKTHHNEKVNRGAKALSSVLTDEVLWKVESSDTIAF